MRPCLDGQRLCLTGGCGFIGSHLLDALHALGAHVSVIDDLSSTDHRHISELMELDPERIRFAQGSILDDDALGSAVAGCSVVLHLAAVGSIQRSIEEPERTFAVNATGSLRVLEAARRARARRVVFASSSSVYGRGETLPKTEALPPAPVSPYAASKLAAETLARVWSETFDLDTVALRYFNVFGPRQRPDSDYAAVIPSFIRRLLRGERPIIFGDGQQSRDFTHVSNVVAATLLAATREAPLRGKVLNVAAGKRTSLLELASTLTELIAIDGDSMARDPEHRPGRSGDVRHSVADISAAQRELAFTPIVPLRQGLTETVSWMRAGAPVGSGD
ncbi:MAG: NAD-dependent epimerase/dehydratase family protein [Phycisphaeraceae bacterium]|nr:NAD-dependent epimerase/dehydratase family protein [Phycisphaeraceae bacterium]